MRLCKFWKPAVVSLGALALALNTQAQVNTNPVPNLAVSWTLDVWGFSGTTGGSGLPVPLPAGLALATNWNDGWQMNFSQVSGVPPVTVNNLFDTTGASTAVSITYSAWSGAATIGGANPAQDANGTYNKQMLNGYLNAGPAAWGPNITNTYVIVSNIPYAQYDVVVYFNSDASGRHGSIDNGSTTYYFSTLGSSAINGANALFRATTETNSAVFPSANFAFFPGMTNASVALTEHPKSGNDQWLGISAFQVIEASNTYVLFGAYPATQIVPIGQPASFSVIAGGQNPNYQWRRNGDNIANATNATYAIAATAPGQDGSYDVVVTNSFSSTTSSVATLTFYAPKTLEWAGNNSVWDTTTSDWTTNNGVGTLAYTETDNVRFGPLGSAQPTVSLSGPRTPTSIVVSNSTYTLVSGSLDGGGSLHLKNNATLILDTVDTRSGWTLIDSGSTFQLDNGDTAGNMSAGALTNNGALIFNAAGDEGYGFPVYGTGSITNIGPSGLITLANSVNANYLVQAGSGSMLLQGNNNLTGGIVVSSGTMMARASGCLGQGPTVVVGGELQMIFNIDYAGTTLSLAGGLLHGGISGSCIYEGVVSLATDSSIQVDGADSLTLTNAAGLNGGSFNLTKTGSGTLVLAGTNNSWNSVNITAGTVQIGNGGTVGGLGSGVIQDDGVLAFNLAGNIVVTNAISGLGGLSQIGSGTVVLTGDASALTGASTISFGKLGGTTTFGGSVDVLPDGTLAPGTTSAIGTLTINGALTIGGNVLVKVNKSLVQSNDLVSVTSVVNTNNGVVTVNNLGPALAVGNSFKLFSQPVTGGETLTISTAGGVLWANNLAVDGSISVVSLTVPQPRIVTSAVSGTDLVFSGTNGIANSAYQVLSSTNIALPVASWTQLSSGTFDGSGNFSVTNTIVPGEPQRFYLLRLP